jgi:hypothetical protein
VPLRSRRGGEGQEARLQLLEGLDVSGCEGVHLAADALEELYAVGDDLVDVDGGVEADFGPALGVDGLEGEKDS